MPVSMFTSRFSVSLTANASRDMDHAVYFLAPYSSPKLLPDSIMFSESEYVSLKGLKSRSPEEETRWQSVRQERRRIQHAEAMRIKRAAVTEKEKDTERARVRERRAKLTPQDAAAATQRNTEQRRLARTKAAAREASEMLILEVSEKGEILSKRSVLVGADEGVAPLPELGDVSDDLAELSVQPAAQGLVAEDLLAGRGGAQLSAYEIIRERNIAERELAFKKIMTMSD